MADALVKLRCLLYGLGLGAARRASRPLEGNAAHMDLAERLWWGYKFYFGPVEEPEPGSGLEEHFRGQDLDFSPGPGFVERSSMTLAAGGDILVSPGLRPETTASLWDEVRGFYFGADLACANLETPVAPSAPQAFLPASIREAPGLNGSPGMFDRMHEGGRGIGLFSTANNHCLDLGEAGLRETLDFLDSRSCPRVGTARSPEEARALVLVERNGLKLAFVAFTFALNWQCLPEGKEYLANYLRLNKPGIDLAPLAAQVAAARAAGADAVVACLHWSLEFEAYPVRHLVETAHRVVELGVDLVIGNHPHNVQPIERHAYLDAATGERREGLVLYALGDLLTLRTTVLPNSHLGLLARVRFAKGESGGRELTRIAGLELLPTYLRPRMRGGRCEDFRLHDLLKLAAELRAGRNPHGLSRAEGRELLRLEALATRLLGPGLRLGAGLRAGAGSGQARA
ncbi:MAG TPA: CapA family protein [Spirochaetales bacterium]|nr:CapA family protein [Spirochaetales bacterium]HRY56303.1 CapA family protein [Spirochaetia bacterium]